MNNLTLVTGLFDLGRENLDGGFERSFQHYKDSFAKMLAVDLPMVIFTSTDLNEFVWKHRNRNNTTVINKTLNDIKSFPFFSQVDEIRTSQEWIDYTSWIANSPQASLELYNPLVMTKHFWLNDASLMNPFNSKYFLWVDGGLSNTIGDPTHHLHESFAKKVISKMSTMLYLGFPYDGEREVHGFVKQDMDRYAGEKTEYVARGGVFGGSKFAINEMNAHYYQLLHDTLNEGLMGTEESLFTILTYKYPQLSNVHMIESNGLVYKFFNDINAIKLEDIETPLGIYALTFNLPKQFKIWAESLHKSLGDGMEDVEKYVINNSTDPDVDEEYQKIFDEYGFTEFKFDNIGICDGRQFAAEHFYDSKHEFMIFFEDDMLLHDKSTLCKNGFNTYYPNLMDTCISIMRNDNLDYLKLSFSEFYGDNHDNWASYNLPPHKKTEYFPHRKDGVSNIKVKIDYTETHKGIPYAVGEYHYCNWPLMFNKKGTKAVFLDKEITHKYEQTWMGDTMDKLRNKEIKVGCLLASTINHNRVYHYGKDTRRENKHYTN